MRVASQALCNVVIPHSSHQAGSEIPLQKIKFQIVLLSNSLSSPVVLKFAFAFMHHLFQDQQILIIKSLMLSYTC